MSLDGVIRSAITPIVTVCVPNLYRVGAGETAATEYCVFNYQEFGAGFGDNEPTAVKYLVQVHWFLPHKTDPYVKKKQIKTALKNAGLTYPIVQNATDEDGQHYVFECEYLDGDV